MDSDFFWHSLGGGAIIAAALTLARLLLDYGFRGGDRRLEQEDRRRGRQRDAEARLERVLQDRLAEADRRLAHFEADIQAERVRCATLERDNVRLMEAYDLLRLQCEASRAERAPAQRG